MAHGCRSSQYSNMRPRYVLGRTIPEAVGIAVAALLGYVAFQLTKGMTYAGQAGKMHLLLVFAAVALPIVVGFVFFLDGAEPYPRQVVGYVRRRTAAAIRSVPARLRPRTRSATAVSILPPLPHPTAARPRAAIDLMGRIIARLRRTVPLAQER